MSETADPRKTFGAAVLEIARGNESVVAVSADSAGSSGLGEFKQVFPHRYFEFGLMEPSIVGYCAGLALAGKIPFFCAITPFITMRAFEQVRDDLAYMATNVKIIGRNAGLAYATLGPTHHSLEDVALMRTLPGMVVLAPTDPVEVRECVEAASQYQGPVYIRIGSQKMAHIHQRQGHFVIGKGQLLHEGGDICVVSTGTMVWNVLQARELLREASVECTVVSMPSIKPLDTQLLLAQARSSRGVVVVEEHSTIGGLGGAVSEVLSESYPLPVKRVGVPDEFSCAGPYQNLIDRYMLSPQGIAEVIRSFAHRLELGQE